LKTQPLDKPNSGSTFVNCAASSLHAWEIIDKLNLRGHTHKGIAFSEKHANFLINVGDAKSTDVEEIIELATKKAKKELNLELKPEVRIIKWNK
jgi:UDP-N-acetylmuramate dehydrogenase